MSSHTVTADMLALDAASAGEHIWRAVELAYAQGATKAVDAFEATLQTLRQSFPEYYAGKLFEATAMNAITQMVDAKRRKEITNAAHDAWTEYVNFLRAEHAAEEADYRADCARDQAIAHPENVEAA